MKSQLRQKAIAILALFALMMGAIPALTGALLAMPASRRLLPMRIFARCTEFREIFRPAAVLIASPLNQSRTVQHGLLPFAHGNPRS
jgi:hypothetical protein